MNYEDYLSGRDIPTVRRLEYVVKGLDPGDVGVLYRMFRNLLFLEVYAPVSGLNEEESRRFASFLRHQFKIQRDGIQERLEEVNRWMREHGLPDIFTDMTDYNQIWRDYDYYWKLRTQAQYDQEERERLEAAGKTADGGEDPK